MKMLFPRFGLIQFPVLVLVCTIFFSSCKTASFSSRKYTPGIFREVIAGAKKTNPVNREDAKLSHSNTRNFIADTLPIIRSEAVITSVDSQVISEEIKTTSSVSSQKSSYTIINTNRPPFFNYYKPITTNHPLTTKEDDGVNTSVVLLFFVIALVLSAALLYLYIRVFPVFILFIAALATSSIAAGLLFVLLVVLLVRLVRSSKNKDSSSS